MMCFETQCAVGCMMRMMLHGPFKLAYENLSTSGGITTDPHTRGSGARWGLPPSPRYSHVS